MWTVVLTRAGGDPNAPSDSRRDFAKRRHLDASEFWCPSLAPGRPSEPLILLYSRPFFWTPTCTGWSRDDLGTAIVRGPLPVLDFCGEYVVPGQLRSRTATPARSQVQPWPSLCKHPPRFGPRLPTDN